MPENVRERILRESQGQFDPIQVVTVLKSFGSASQPVLVTCSDQESYVIKGSQNHKMLYNEYVCGRLGNLLDAPVGWLRFVEIPDPLRTGGLGHFGLGFALGSFRIPMASERAGVQYVDVPQNKAGFAALCILYSWCKAQDHQLLYQEVPPQLARSCDHGHFFPSGPNWTIDTLKNEPAVVRDTFFDACGLTQNDFAPYWPKLVAVTDQEILAICGVGPAEWNVPVAEREAMGQYLIQRRAQVQQAF